jgi:hypothetical protein
MDRKFWNKTNIFGISGIFAYAVTTLVLFIPFKGEPGMSLVNWHSPLGIIVLILFVISVGLYAWGILKREHNLSFNDKKVIVAERQEILPKLRLSMESKLKATRPLINRAENLPLNQYWEKYLKNTMPYLITKQRPQKPLEITNKLVRKKFPLNNLYYQELKENDANYKQVEDNYNIILSKIDDSELKKSLKWLWRSEHFAHSAQIYASLSMKNKNIPNVPLGYRLGLKSKHFTESGFQDCLREVENRIYYLLRGDDL